MKKKAIKFFISRLSHDLRVCKHRAEKLATKKLFDPNDQALSAAKPEVFLGTSNMSTEKSLELFRGLLVQVLREELGAIFSADGTFVEWSSPEHAASALQRVCMADVKRDIGELTQQLSRIKDTTPEELREADGKLQAAERQAEMLRNQADDLERAAKRMHEEETDQANKRRRAPEDIEREKAPIQAKLAEAEALLKRRKAVRRPRATGKKAGPKAATGRSAKQARSEDDTGTSLSPSE